MNPAKASADQRLLLPDAPRREAAELIAYYQGKADECMAAAREAPDATARDHWLSIANGWTALVMQFQRR